ncbi:hypothetical protein M5K25_026092 [Dendrobium thyrsiflorum]|uniref:DUF1995 domain-containing protein n=1 Tax=Dendrobium thyrsiflorum TaxID=117978 RepID=A0ABD0TWP8_DENTH
MDLMAAKCLEKTLFAVLCEIPLGDEVFLQEILVEESKKRGQPKGAGLGKIDPVAWRRTSMARDFNYQFSAFAYSTFTVAYSMRPLPSGAIFRCYPGLWKVFYDDVNRPNRYLLAKEQPSRPDATDIEQIFGTVSQKSEEAPSLFGKAMGMFTSLNRFMRAISR